MASLLKNQILKHLSKFTKNLSPDKINLSTLKGEGELSNLELDENVLTELLDLPTWLNIKKASCNRVSIKIQWTKLKSQPILLCLDEVIIETETCETPRPPSKPGSSDSQYRSGGKYGFIEIVLDGIFVRVNSVLVKLVSKTFQAAVELSRLTVKSVTPTWKESNNLRQTRIKEVERDAVLLFKEIEWQNTRINASSVNVGVTDFSSPLRLIANQAKIRITTKKRLSDSSVIASRLTLHLADLLWVLTKTQLKEAILYANSLTKIIENSSQQSKQRAAEQLQQQSYHNVTTDPSRNQSPSHHHKVINEIFNRHDVLTTSYHVNINPINLHLCDDTTNGTVGSKERLWNIEGGSMQITMYKLTLDFYPFHQAGGERKKWYDYKEVGTRNIWVQKLFNEFRTDAVNIRKAGVNSPTTQKAANSKASMQTSGVSSPVKSRSTKLLESCSVLKVSDIAIYMVSTSSTKQSTMHKFLSSDKKQLHLPADTSTIHMEHTSYFFPEEISYPVPDTNMYMMVNPMRLTIDYTTLLWANYFFMDLSQNVDMDLMESEEPTEHTDIKIEAVMPRIILPAETKVEGQPERPEYLQIVVSRLCATNVSVEEKTSRADLQNLIDKYETGNLFYADSFPNENKKFQIIPEPLQNHASNVDNPYINSSVKIILQTVSAEGSPKVQCNLHSNTLKKKANCDIWCVTMDFVWLEFLGVNNYKSRPVPFVEGFPLTLWLSGKPAKKKVPDSSPDRANRSSVRKLKQYYSSEESETGTNGDRNQLADNHVIADIGAKINLQINHYQYLFLMRLNESMTRFQSQLTSDLLLFMDAGPSSFCIPLLIPALEVAVVCPFLSHLQTFPDDFGSPVHTFCKDANIYSPEHRKIKAMGHKKQASNSAPNRISINTNDSTSSLEDNPNIMITKSMSDSTIHAMPTDTCDFNAEIIAVTEDICKINGNDANFNSLQRKSSSTNAIPSEIHNQELHTTSSLGGDSGIFMESRGNFARYMKPMNSMFSNISDKITGNKLTGSNNDLLSVMDDDNMSTFTDQSDEDYVDLSLEESEGPVFSNDNPYETASVTDTYSDDCSSVYADSITTKTKEMVSVVVFKLDKPEVLLYGSDGIANTALQIASLATCCPGNMSLEEVHSKLSGKGFFTDEKDSKNTEPSPAHFPIKMTLVAESPSPHNSTSLSPEHKRTERTTKKDCMVIKASNIPIHLKMSAITSLTEFIEEEKLPEIIPMKVILSDLMLILSEDRPSVNVGSFTPPPQNIHINRLHIERSFDGIFNIKALSAEPELNGTNINNDLSGVNPSSDSPSALHSSFLLLQAENINLNQKLSDMTKIRKDKEVLQTQLSLTSGELEKLRNENIALVDRIQLISRANDSQSDGNLETQNLHLQSKILDLEGELDMANKEKESLLDTMKLLQDELLSSEKRYRQRQTD
ncbi:hypothetical protein SNE40_003151 [Patella caerulea]|uniref:UHRF1-binding protein 1-like n=1 Tax=Patella caerulea TaxID=87958 RepID=A0AAN8K2E7_PATCE